MKHSLPAAFLLSLSLATYSFAADKKPKPPTGTPSTLPPTSPMLVVPQPDAVSTDGKPPAKLISSEMSGRDLGFFMKTVEAGREQAFFVDLLKKSASSDRIKTLADTLSASQTEENAHILKLATQKGLNVSLEPTAAEKKTAEELAKLSGSNFDKAVMDKVAAADSQALTAYQDAAQSTDPQIKSFATQMLPLAEEKRHIVEKMTGAGSKAANQLFRHGGVSESTPAATPAATPAGKGTPAPSMKSTPSASPKATAIPAGKGTPAAATPTPTPSAKSTPTSTPATPAATPAGKGTPAPSMKSTPSASPKATATPAGKGTPVAATPTPPPPSKNTPASTPGATPAPQHSILGLPVATPPGQGTPVPMLPPIAPLKVPPTPALLK